MENTKQNKLLNIGVLITSFIQIIFPVFSRFQGENSEFNTDPQITPATYAFSIWVLITTLGLSFGIYQMLPNRQNSQLHKKIAQKLIILYTLFCIWMYGAGQQWRIGTILIFITMLVFAFKTFQQILQERENFGWVEKLLLEAQLGLYTGWSAVAIFVNTAVAIKFYGFTDIGTNGIIWQSLLLILALSNSIYGFYKTNSNYFFGGTILWAFVAIYIGLRQEPNDTFVLQQIVIAAIISLFSSFFIIKKYKKTSQI